MTGQETLSAATFGLAVRQARTNRGWSQTELAEASQIDRSYMSCLERGERNPTLLVQIKIASALKLPLSTLVRRGEELS